MSHKKEKLLERIDKDLTDLEVRNPKKAEQYESELRRLEARANFDVALSPVGIRDMERGR